MNLSDSKLKTDEVIEGRTMSGFALSIGTGIAMETILDPTQAVYDPERKAPPKADLNSYQQLWINAATLLRNIYGAVPSGSIGSIDAGGAYLALVGEIQTIVSLVQQEYPHLAVVVYLNDTTQLARIHPHGLLKKAETPKQMLQEQVFKKITALLLKNHAAEIANFTGKLRHEQKQKALILTHVPYDLLSHVNFRELDLLESHTGAVKSRAVWYTKFGNKQQVQIPFNVCMLQVFGDGVTFSAHTPALRREVIELADKYNWHSLTTDDRLRYSFGTMKDIFSAQILKKMLSEF